MIHKKISTLITLLSVAGYLSIGCGGGATTVKAAKRAKDEQPSIEVSLDRIEDLKLLQQQLDDFIIRSPLSANAPWVAMIQQVPPEKAAAIISQVQSRAPYDLPGTSIPPSKVLVIYNEEVIIESTSFIGDYLNFMTALEGLGFPEGSKIRNKYEGVKANRTEIANLEGEIEGLEAEADLDSTPNRRKSMIASQIERIETNIEALEERNKTAQDALFGELDSLKSHGMVGADLQPLASSLFFVAQHVALMEDEAMITSKLVGIQLLRSIPNLPQELQGMAKRLMGSVMAELGQQSAAAQNANIDIKIQDGSLMISVSGLERVDPGAVQHDDYSSFHKLCSIR